MISGFSWIIEDKLAGSGIPGVYGDAKQDVSFLANLGFSHIVSLVEEDPKEVFDSLDTVQRHFPIPDMNVPDKSKLKSLLEEMDHWIENDGKVLVHCKAGLGRTGVVLAGYHIHKGMNAQLAIDTVRKINPAYIQNNTQERFLRTFGLMYPSSLI